jgi:uncharacterized protein with PIN domain
MAEALFRFYAELNDFLPRLEPVAKEDVRSQLPARTAAFDEEFRRCPDCRRVYWKGGHYRRMRELMAAYTEEKV